MKPTYSLGNILVVLVELEIVRASDDDRHVETQTQFNNFHKFLNINANISVLIEKNEANNTEIHLVSNQDRCASLRGTR